MNIKNQLYTDSLPFYQDIESAIKGARNQVYMAYYAFDHGKWAKRFAKSMSQKAAEGVKVHLMIDQAGIYLENISNFQSNRKLLNDLRLAGVKVHIFRPDGRRIGPFNRLHCKFCAIDNHTAFIGGSNIGDHYLKWRDTNLKIEGDLGDDFGRLYRTLKIFGSSSTKQPHRPGHLQVGEHPLLLTLPGHHKEIRRALLALIFDARESINLRSWYFLPDREIAQALLSQAEQGVRINVLFSHKTRFPLIDLANRPLTRQLTRAGARIYRYCGTYMHAKEAWNEQGTILFGSANIDRWALHSNFECCLQINSLPLAHELTHQFQVDIHKCLNSTAKTNSKHEPLLGNLLQVPK